MTVRALLMLTTCLAWSQLSPSLIGDARAQSGPGAADVDASAAKAEADIRAARLAAAARPADEAPLRNLIDTLARAGRIRDAVAESDGFARRAHASAMLRAQRGFLRRRLNDVAGAIEDFSAALNGTELAADQRHNVEEGLAEARVVAAQGDLTRAQDDMAEGNFTKAAEDAQLMLAGHPESEPAMRIRIDALTRAGHKREALANVDRFVKQGAKDPQLRAQRGYLRRELDDPQGAADDFAAVLLDPALVPEQRRNLEAALAEARGAVQSPAAPDIGDAALKRRDYAAALAASQAALESNPDSEAAMGVRIEALIRAGRQRDAAAEADAFMSRHTVSATLYAQRGFLRRELRNTAGAIDDFSAALAGEGLSAEQRKNVEAAFAEARTADLQGDSGRAQAALRQRDFATAARLAKDILQRDPNSDGAMRILIDALTRAGRKREARDEMDRLIARGHAQGWLYAQRGFARSDAGDFPGALRAFNAALGRGDIDGPSASNIRYARAVAKASLADREGKPQDAEAAYREVLVTDPNQADAWFRLGYLLLKQGQRDKGAEALSKGLALRPNGPAYLDAANASILTNAPRAQKFYPEGLDRWYAGETSLASRSATDQQRVKNEVVEADASIRTTMGVGLITARPATAGGNNLALGADTRVRFDGNYLPDVEGLEAFAHGLSGKDSNGIRETEAGVGLRYRPLRDVNLYFGGMVDHFFQPNSEYELVLNWGLGLGADPYPYARGWKPYWDFGTFGAWRTADTRVLEDVRANAGFLYELPAPLRVAVGPTILAVSGYDNKAVNPIASGIGPSLLTNVWIGGDKYRSYDAVISLQVGYLFNIGIDERQRGWRALLGVTF
jgi:tetratricopeptide (TPR) repeat protein